MEFLIAKTFHVLLAQCILPKFSLCSKFIVVMTSNFKYSCESITNNVKITYKGDCQNAELFLAKKISLNGAVQYTNWAFLTVGQSSACP